MIAKSMVAAIVAGWVGVAEARTDIMRPMYVEDQATVCTSYFEMLTLKQMAAQGVPVSEQPNYVQGCSRVRGVSRVFLLAEIGTVWHLRIVQPDGYIQDLWTLSLFVSNASDQTPRLQLR